MRKEGKKNETNKRGGRPSKKQWDRKRQEKKRWKEESGSARKVGNS